MDNIKLMEEMLNRYNYFKSRNILLEKKKRFLQNSSSGELENHTKMISNLFDYDNPEDQDISKIDNDIKKNNYAISIIDSSLDMLKQYDERYMIIIEYYYIKKVRMEDIAEITHMCRSRCYELRKEAIMYMAKITFGDDCTLVKQ